jgi:hypothetical protein
MAMLRAAEAPRRAKAPPKPLARRRPLRRLMCADGVLVRRLAARGSGGHTGTGSSRACGPHGEEFGEDVIAEGAEVFAAQPLGE